MASREEDRNGGPSDKHGAPVATCNPASPAADAATHSGETDVQVKKSVSFSSPPPSMRSSRDQLGPAERHAAEGEVDESSADETTAIVGQELGGWKDYNTNTAAAASGSDVPGAGVATEGVATQQAEVIGHKAAGIGPRESRQRKRRDRGAQEQDGRQDGDTEAESEPKIGWWRQLIDKYGSVELENKGSVARDHLALGRMSNSFKASSVVLMFHFGQLQDWNILNSSAHLGSTG